MLENHSKEGRQPMHMPGHKRNPAAGDAAFATDITEIEGFDNLHSPSGAIKDICLKAASLWNAREAVLSVNGATGLILASILACARKGGKILIAANCHISVWHAVELAGLTPVIVMPDMDDSLPFAGRLSPDSVAAAVADASDAVALVYTSPTYEGVISDTGSIADVAHKAGIPVILDMAHGAHLGLSSELPADGVADIVIKSIHKTLSAPTQTAVLLTFSDRIPMRLISHYMNVTETTSPSYVLMGGVSRCIYDLAENGIGDLPKILADARSALSSLTRLQLFPSDDPSKFVIMTGGVISGHELGERIRNIHNIEPEAVFSDYIIFMTGTGDTADSLKRLTDALIGEDRRLSDKESPITATPVPVMTRCDLIWKIDIGDAVRAGHTAVPLTEAEGMVAGEYIFAYPPGIPVAVPGAVISGETVRYLKILSESGTMPVTEPYRAWDNSVLTVDMQAKQPL